MDWNKKNSNCCGSGGGLRISYPKIAEAVGIRRLDEALATGAELIATACPFCKDQMMEIQNTSVQAYRKLPVVDIAEIISGTHNVDP